MARKHTIYWYQEGPEFRSAFLFHLRDGDVKQGGKFKKGDVVEGTGGYVVAEADVFGWTVAIVPFSPTRRCEWHGFVMPCMVHRQAPPGKHPSAQLRAFNYIVAQLTDPAAEIKAAEIGLPVIPTDAGQKLVNLEIGRFEAQAHQRRATLLP